MGNQQITDDRPLIWVRREGWHYGGQAYYAARYKAHKLLLNSAYEPLQFFNIETDMLETTPLTSENEENFKERRMMYRSISEKLVRFHGRNINF